MTSDVAFEFSHAFLQFYAERLREAQADKAHFKAVHPIFYYNVPMAPGEILSLHLFEPRYKLMMKRIIETSRRFAYVPNYTDYQAQEGDFALLAEVRAHAGLLCTRCWR